MTIEGITVRNCACGRERRRTLECPYCREPFSVCNLKTCSDVVRMEMRRCVRRPRKRT